MQNKISGICKICMRRRLCKSPDNYANINNCSALRIHANRGKKQNNQTEPRDS